MLLLNIHLLIRFTHVLSIDSFKKSGLKENFIHVKKQHIAIIY